VLGRASVCTQKKKQKKPCAQKAVKVVRDWNNQSTRKGGKQDRRKKKKTSNRKERGKSREIKRRTDSELDQHSLILEKKKKGG